MTFIHSLLAVVTLLTVFQVSVNANHGEFTQKLVVCNIQSKLDNQEKTGKRIYVDMVADLFHAGHVEFLKQAKALGDYLIVGLCNDEVCAGYKRLPILTQEERVAVVSGCRYVDAILPDAPLVETDALIDELKIDLVVHGDDFDTVKLNKYYGVPIRRNMYKTVPYTKGISTTEIIKRIMDRAAINDIDNDGHTLLTRALENKSFECAEVLIKAGADVNKRNQSGEAPLWIAVTKWFCDCIAASGERIRYISIIKQLVAHKADVSESLLWLDRTMQIVPSLEAFEATEYDIQQIVALLKK